MVEFGLLRGSLLKRKEEMMTLDKPRGLFIGAEELSATIRKFQVLTDSANMCRSQGTTCETVQN